MKEFIITWSRVSLAASEDANDDDGDHDDGHRAHHRHNEVHVGEEIHDGVFDIGQFGVIGVEAVAGDFARGRQSSLKTGIRS